MQGIKLGHGFTGGKKEEEAQRKEEEEKSAQTEEETQEAVVCWVGLQSNLSIANVMQTCQLWSQE